MDGSDALTMPGEWVAHECTVMAWPCRRSLWGAHLDAAKAAYAATARAVATAEPVLLVARPGDGREAGQACGEGVEVVEWPLDDSWTRDIGALVVTGADRRAGVDFVFNGWGEKYTPYDEDARFGARMCEHLNLEHTDAAPFVLEGGAVTVDGTGTLVTTEECLLNPNRNPALDREQIEAELRRWLGVERVVWLPYGLVEDDGTDGHVDNVAAFIAPGIALAQTARDRSNPNFGRLCRNVEVLREAGIEVREIDVLPYATVGDERVVVPPTNLYQAGTGLVVVPIVAGDEGAAALDAVRRAVPDRDVVGVPGEVLAHGGGGVHCITQQVPRG